MNSISDDVRNDDIDDEKPSTSFQVSKAKKEISKILVFSDISDTDCLSDSDFNSSESLSEEAESISKKTIVYPNKLEVETIAIKNSSDIKKAPRLPKQKKQTSSDKDHIDFKIN